MGLVNHAKKELTQAGLFDKDSDYEGMLGKSVLELIEVFAKQGHSGFSAELTTQLFERLVRYKPLSPINSNPDEWVEVTSNMWQNKRQYSCFSNDGGKTWYDIDSKKWRRKQKIRWFFLDVKNIITYPVRIFQKPPKIEDQPLIYAGKSEQNQSQDLNQKINNE